MKCAAELDAFGHKWNRRSIEEGSEPPCAACWKRAQRMKESGWNQAAGKSQPTKEKKVKRVLISLDSGPDDLYHGRSRRGQWKGQNVDSEDVTRGSEWG